MAVENNVFKIINELNLNGFSSSNVSEIFDESEMKYFEEILSFYSKALEDVKIKKRIEEINNNIIAVNSKYKIYEITHDELLDGPLTLDNLPLLKLYLSKNILKIAESYLESDIKIRNPLAWIHPATINKKEIRSQKWHRDQEDYKMLKVFILFSNVDENNGPTQYIKGTNFCGKHKNIAPNMNWTKDHWSNKNKLVKKVYNFIREKIPYNYPLPKHNIVKATGKVGKIFFIDTNGLHKGGQVKEGIRLLTHCNYLRESAPMLKKGMPLENLNSDDKLFAIDYNSIEFKSLDKKQKHTLL
jgi:hypothetical protein